MAEDQPIVSGLGEPGLVSVVIPTYNRAYIVGEAIRSVLDQSYRPVEVVVVDDGSADDTRAVVERFGPPVRYVYQPNAGVSAARNRGFREARGEFVALLDSDDRWLGWKLEAQVRLLRRFPDVGMVWTDMAATDEAGGVFDPAYLRTFYSAHRDIRIEGVMEGGGSLGEAWPGAPAEAAGRPFYHGDIFSPMILGNLVHTSTVLLRRDRLAKVGGFDPSLLRTGEDYEFHLRTCSHGPVGFLDASSILYRCGAADQLTARDPQLGLFMARNNLTTVERWLDRGRGRIALPGRVVRRHLAESYGWLGEAKIGVGDFRGGRADLRHSLWLWPGQPRRWALLLYNSLPQALRDATRAIRGRPPAARPEPG